MIDMISVFVNVVLMPVALIGISYVEDRRADQERLRERTQFVSLVRGFSTLALIATLCSMIVILGADRGLIAWLLLFCLWEIMLSLLNNSVPRRASHD